MKLKITGIRDAGDINKERVVMRAVSALAIGEYAVFQTGHSDGSVTNDVHTTYWFPDGDVAEGDFVILYTKAGIPKQQPFKEVKSHFYYWGRQQPIWGTAGRAAVLLHSPVWDSFTP